MDKYVRDFIEYSGISKDIPDGIRAFKNISVDGQFRLSEKKPGIKGFLKCSVYGDIKSSRLINGAFGSGADGKNLTGFKCAVDGVVNCRVEYIGLDGSELIYTDRVKIPCITNVSLTEDYMYSNKVVSSIFIDDIYLEMVNSREYILSISGIITVED